MMCDIGMLINGRRGPKIYLESFPTGPCQLPGMLLITLHSVTLIPVNHFTFLCDCILVLGGNQEVFECVALIEVNLNAHFTTYVFETFTKLFGIGHHEMDVVVLVVVVCLLFAVMGAVLVVVFLF